MSNYFKAFMCFKYIERIKAGIYHRNTKVKTLFSQFYGLNLLCVIERCSNGSGLQEFALLKNTCDAKG